MTLVNFLPSSSDDGDEDDEIEMTLPPELCIVRNGDIGKEETDSSVFLLIFFGEGFIPSTDEFKFWVLGQLGPWAQYEVL